VAEEFLRAIAPIVYRKTLDFGTIEDMRQMKRRIDAEAQRRRGQGWDVKLGRGGIREIEFIAQSLQLVHAGRNPVLRERGTLALLERLKEARLLDEKEVQDLSAAYRFFRSLEHRIQMAEDRQTHLLPTRAAELERLARSMGFPEEPGEGALRAFHDRLEIHRGRVEAAFDRLLAEGGSDEAAQEEEVDPAVRELLDLTLPPEEERQRLASLGFEDPAGAAARLVWLREPPPMADLSVRGRRLLRAHSPAFLQEITRAPDPDRALAHLETFFSSSRARYTLFTVLAAHRETLRLLIRLFGTSDYLSEAFIQHPELLDSLVLSSYATIRKARAEMEREIADALPEMDDFEGRLDALRRFKRGELLRIAFNDLSGSLGREEVSAQLSDLAEACLTSALAIAREEMDERFGPPGDAGDPGGVARFALLGMGKLGGREIDYHSDLDIIFVFDPQGETRGGSRGRRISNMEYFIKIAQRIITLMTLRTTEGSLFEIDARLRPSGNAGPLVTTLESFERYHAESAQLWERQALIKARFVAGDVALGSRLEGAAGRFAYGRPWDPSVSEEIGRIRARMEKEIAREKPGVLNVKTGRGGIVDVEFIVQLLQLRHGPADPDLRAPNTLAALEALRRKGRIRAGDAEDLQAGYTFLRTLEDRLRLLRNRSTSELESGEPELDKLARRLGYADRPSRSAVDGLLAEYHARTERIRAIYERVFGADRGHASGAAEERAP
jgi:glutamate-ammonia-ligase adenylyltransferase